MSGDLSKFVQISYHPLAFVSSALPVAPVDAGTIWAKRSGNFSLTLSPIAVITSMERLRERFCITWLRRLDVAILASLPCPLASQNYLES